MNLIYFILLANKHSIFNLFSEKRTGSKAAKISGCNNSVTSDVAGFGSTINTACEKQEVIKQWLWNEFISTRNLPAGK